MNKRPGHVNVTVETGYCNFCGRARNLRREEHQLGTLVRTIITCESCHRTLSSQIGVASTEPEAVEAQTPTVGAPATAESRSQPRASARAKAAAGSKAPSRAKAPAKAEAKPRPKAAAKGSNKPAESTTKTKTPTRRTTTKKK
jgi:hypothetical protein